MDVARSAVGDETAPVRDRCGAEAARERCGAKLAAVASASAVKILETAML
jgi:hypothetical protein